MQDFLKEWGPAIITAVVVVLLVAIVKYVAPSVREGMANNVKQFTDDASSAHASADTIITPSK